MRGRCSKARTWYTNIKKRKKEKTHTLTNVSNDNIGNNGQLLLIVIAMTVITPKIITITIIIIHIIDQKIVA